jgi:hypothetical protein
MAAQVCIIIQNPDFKYFQNVNSLPAEINIKGIMGLIKVKAWNYG